MSADKKLVFDIETQKSFEEIGGSLNLPLLGVSVVGVYDYSTDQFLTFEEPELFKLEELMSGASLIIGFNSKYFDYPVLQAYFKRITLERLPTLDLMEQLAQVVGYRVGLDALSKSTLGEQKSSHGLEALKWFKEGRIDEVKKYCLQDVKLTRDLYEYGLKHGSVFFESRTNGLISIAASWGAHQEEPSIRSLLDQAWKEKQIIEIDYVSTRAEDGEDTRKRRQIEIHAIKGDIIEAFCHMRQDKRYFQLRRILDAKLISADHQRPTLF